MRTSHEITSEVAPKNDLGSHRFIKGVFKFSMKKFTEGNLEFNEARKNNVSAKCNN
jgi:hypothetical protein